MYVDSKKFEFGKWQRLEYLENFEVFAQTSWFLQSFYPNFLVSAKQMAK